MIELVSPVAGLASITTAESLKVEAFAFARVQSDLGSSSLSVRKDGL